MKNFFWADTHFDHDGILQITDRDQDFSTVEEHNDALIEGINRTVGEKDRLFIVGDFAWRAGESIIRRIRCKNLHLIWGNHDKGSYAKLFKTVEDTTIIKVQGHKLFLSHYPHAYWPASHRGSLHLYGHVHAEREVTLDMLFPGRRSMDCGVDNARVLLGDYRPFSEDEVIRFLTARTGHDSVEWYNEQRAKRRGLERCQLTDDAVDAVFGESAPALFEIPARVEVELKHDGQGWMVVKAAPAEIRRQALNADGTWSKVTATKYRNPDDAVKLAEKFGYAFYKPAQK